MPGVVDADPSFSLDALKNPTGGIQSPMRRWGLILPSNASINEFHGPRFCWNFLNIVQISDKGEGISGNDDK